MTEDLKLLFGKRIAKLRNLNGISQEELAEQINLSSRTLSSIECGAYFTQAENIEKIAKVLGVEVCDLFDFKNIEDKEALVKEIHNKIEILKNDDDKLLTLYTIIKSML